MWLINAIKYLFNQHDIAYTMKHHTFSYLTQENFPVSSAQIFIQGSVQHCKNINQDACSSARFVIKIGRILGEDLKTDVYISTLIIASFILMHGLVLGCEKRNKGTNAILMSS